MGGVAQRLRWEVKHVLNDFFSMSGQVFLGEG